MVRPCSCPASDKLAKVAYKEVQVSRLQLRIYLRPAIFLSSSGVKLRAASQQ